MTNTYFPMTNKYYIIGFQDHADGEAYAHGKIWTANTLSHAQDKAIELLADMSFPSDHVCIGKLESISGKVTINALSAIAPHSLILSAGDDFEFPSNVNKL